MITTSSFDIRDQHSDAKRPNRPYTAPVINNGEQPFSAFERVAGNRMQGMSVRSLAKAGSRPSNEQAA